jgi:hypothetical protein
MQQTIFYKVEDQSMNAAKSLRMLHPNSGQIIDVEKAPVVDFADRHTPMRHPVMLAFQ